MDLAQDVLIVLDTGGVIQDVNEAAAQLHDLPVAELIGTSAARFLHPSSAEQMLHIASALYFSGVDSTDTMRLEAYRHDGETVHVELRVSYSAEDEMFYVVQRDVTDQVAQTLQLKKLTEELHHQTLTDTLTGVPNRAAFEARMSEVHEADEEAWLAILDLDNFKRINDTHGHVVGDALLVAVANAVGQAIEPGELFARIGGDEFALIAPATDAADFERRIGRAEALVNGTVDLDDGLQLIASCSIGAVQRQPGESNFSWLRRSDRDMYDAKSVGRREISPPLRIIR